MKRTCNGCKAFGLDRCNLGYKIATKTTFHGISVEYKPLELCPKPKTYDKYLKEVWKND